MAGPLEGIRVFDWTGYGVGPFSTSILGALGAEVIKIDPPGGEMAQRVASGSPAGGTINGVEGFWLNFNMNKKDVILDLKSEEGRTQALKLLASCDVFVNNLRTGVPEKLGFGYEPVRKVNPKIIYCVSRGWGKSGPMAPVGGGDGVVQAFCGWTSITGARGGPGEYLRYQGQIDLNTSIYIASSILLALVTRDRTGVGQEIDMTMLGAAVAMQSSRIAEYLATGKNPMPLGAAAGTSAPHQYFHCMDAKWLAVGVETDSQWQALCKALEAPELAAAPRFATNPDRVAHRDELAEALKPIFNSKASLWWHHHLTRNGVPNSLPWDFDQLRSHPQNLLNEQMMTVDTGRAGVITTGGPPWKFSKSPARMERACYSGEHDAEILGALPSGPVVMTTPPPLEKVSGGPLKGLKILELAQGVSGPYCGQVLGDSGAEVIKVESTKGDYARQFGPPFQGEESAVFLALNRNKKGVTLDTGSVEGQQQLQELVRWADVLTADWRGPAGEEPAISYEEAVALNPKIVYCSLSPYGEKGPLAEMPSSELVLQAQSNIWAGLGVPGEEPRRLGADQVTMDAGIFAFQAIMSALHWRGTHGQGQRVAVSALGGINYIKGMHWVPFSNPDYWPGVVAQGPHSLRTFTDPPNHGYATKDLPVMFQVRDASEDDFKALLKELGITSDMVYGRAADPTKHYTSIENKPVWERGFKDKTATQLTEIFASHKCDIIPYNTYATLFAHAQTKELNLLREYDHPKAGKVKAISTPWQMHLTPEEPVYQPAPLLGQHNKELAAGSLTKGGKAKVSP